MGKFRVVLLSFAKHVGLYPKNTEDLFQHFELSEAIDLEAGKITQSRVDLREKLQQCLGPV